MSVDDIPFWFLTGKDIGNRLETILHHIKVGNKTKAGNLFEELVKEIITED